MSLNLQSTIRRLETYSDSSSPILSVYLEIPSEKEDNKNLIKIFKNLVHISLTQEEQVTFAQAIATIEGYLEQFRYNSDEKGIAFFVGGDNLWEVIHTKGAATTSLVIHHSPNLTPLFEEEKTYQRYLIVLADREKAKFILLSGGGIEDQCEVQDPSVPPKIHTGEAGSRQDKVDRHIQKLLNIHLDLFSKKLNEFVNDKPINGVLVGGHKTLIHQIEKHLPKHLQEKVLGEFVSELNISTNEILSHCKKLLDKFNIKFPQRNQSSNINP